MTKNKPIPDPKSMAAIQLGLDLPTECAPGVAANLALLNQHRAVLEDFDAHAFDGLDQGNKRSGDE